MPSYVHDRLRASVGLGPKGQVPSFKEVPAKNIALHNSYIQEAIDYHKNAIRLLEQQLEKKRDD